MTASTIDPQLDLVLERLVPLTPEQLFNGWTQPDILVHWFTPAPWKTLEATTDLRPGGLFHTVMKGPEPGQQFANDGCFLELIPNEKIVWTSALREDFRPQNAPATGFAFTAILTFERQGDQTKYTAIGRHADEAARQRHEAMGFQEGWGKALDQLIAYYGAR